MTNFENRNVDTQLLYPLFFDRWFVHFRKLTRLYRSSRASTCNARFAQLVLVQTEHLSTYVRFTHADEAIYRSIFEFRSSFFDNRRMENGLSYMDERNGFCSHNGFRQSPIVNFWSSNFENQIIHTRSSIVNRVSTFWLSWIIPSSFSLTFLKNSLEGFVNIFPNIP